MTREHELKLKRIAAQVSEFYRAKIPFRIFHGSTNSTRILTFKKEAMLDVSDLNKILSIDTVAATAVVEANVPMDALVNATLRHGLVPPVITEFPGITVGGGIQGGAGESSSFKWGFFSQTVNWVEYVLGDGSVLRASLAKHADLFYGGAGSSGTLGVITAMEIRLIPSRRYVQLTYLPVAGFASALSTMQRCVTGDYDFIDGIMFGKQHGVIIAGKLSDDKAGKIRRFSRARDPWFYLHAERIDAQLHSVTETVPLRDYLFRYNRGAFWVGRYAFERFGVPFNGFTRFVLNPMLSTRKLYWALQTSGVSQEHIVQDLTLPVDKAESFLEYIDKSTGTYPLWLCPIKPEPRSPLLCNGLDTPLAINVGVWGRQISDYDAFKRLNRQIETKLMDLGGKKWMYAHTYYTEAEFWKIYDKAWYQKLRKKYKAAYLPSIYDKVVVREQYAINTHGSLVKTITGTAKLRVK
ncbi:MAG TPA: FAD-binding oxidoreductase [Candidatus Saccharimonadales bacterium]|jgi:FAD/FMN-containing dehydrogenase